MTSTRILWTRVWGLAGLQGAITLCWVIYNLYLPQLLIQIGLSKELAIALLIIENLLEAIIEPIFGRLSDRQQRNYGSRLPVITVGVVVAALLFAALPGLTLWGGGPRRLVLPVLAVFWASAMAIFRAPAMALLGQLATSSNLPRAASVLTLVGGIVGALRFDAYGWILSWGAGFAFILGSLTLLVAAVVLRWLNSPQVAPSASGVRQSSSMSKYALGLLLITGMAVGWSLRFLIPAIKQILVAGLGDEYSKLAMTGFFIILGLLAVPAGKIAAKWGNTWGMMGGAILVMLMLFVSRLLPSGWAAWGALSLLPGGFCLVLNGAVPFALALAAPGSGGWAIGMYFGGLNAGIGLFEFIFFKLGTNSLNTNLGGASCSLMLVLLCLLLGDKLLSGDRLNQT